MGNLVCNCGKCGKKEIPDCGEYFYKINNDEPKIETKGISLRKEVKLELAIKNVKGGNCRVQSIFYSDSKKQIKFRGGTTDEVKFDSSLRKISFLRYFITDYCFQIEQPIDFIISGSINAKISTCLSQIMGSKGIIFNKPIDGYGGAVFEVRGFEYQNKKTSDINFNISLEGNFLEMNIIYLIKYLGNSNKRQNTLLYRSEYLSQKAWENKLNFSQSSIPDNYLAPDIDYNNNNIEIEIYDNNHQNSLGRYSGKLGKLIGNKTNISLGPDKNAILDVYLNKNYSFIDYLKGGMQINLSIAIDFSISNKKQTLPDSLHYVGHEPNQYETAILGCGNIVANYDYDQLFPAYGFAGKFLGNPSVDHCFPLNGNYEDPKIYSIQGILQTYKKIIKETQLSGPNLYHFIIDKIISDVEKENKMNYHILMILTDGMIDDLKQTINSLVKASYLPISIIIIGIGNGNFKKMNSLDSDEGILVDSQGKKADRDIVQFVPFNKFKYDGEELAKEVLAEIPRQIIDYFQHHRIPPGETNFPKVEVK